MSTTSTSLLQSATAEKPAWLDRAVTALRECEVLYITAGAGMSADSGLPTFRSKEGFWNAYPPAAKAGLSFAQVSNPSSFVRDERVGWGFFAHRYHLYTKAEPHEGYYILKRWADRVGKSFVFTSNVDGMFERAGFPTDSILECHGSIHFVQYRDPRTFGMDVIPAAETTLPSLHVDEHFKAQGELPTIKEKPSRPNIMMFSDPYFTETRLQKQEENHDRFFAKMKKKAKVVVVEIGAGQAVPTVRFTSESVLERNPNATLIRINIDEPFYEDLPEQTIPVPLGGKTALEAIDEELKKHS